VVGYRLPERVGITDSRNEIDDGVSCDSCPIDSLRLIGFVGLQVYKEGWCRVVDGGRTLRL